MGLSRRGLTEDLLPHVQDRIGVGDLRIVFQPLLDLWTAEIFAYEALVRSSDQGFESPVQLFDRAIELDCCGELGRLLRGLAVDGCPGAPLFLNIHPKEFDDGWLLRPDDPIFRHEHPVFIEITESVPLSHAAFCSETLQEVRDRGVQLAVDDLGAGYSNLKYIADLHPEIVKFDRGLIAGLTTDSRLFRLVRSVVRLCVELGAQVVAEGIETPEELHAVRQAGAQFGQGYLIARPAFPPPASSVDVFSSSAPVAPG